MSTAPAELIEIATRHQVYLEGLKTGEVNKLSDFLNQMDRDLRRRLSGRDITSYNRARLERLLKSVQSDISAVMSGVTDAVRQASLDLGSYESGFEQRSLARLGMRVEFVVPAAAAVRSAVLNNPLSVRGLDGGMMLKPFLDNLSKRTQERVASVIRLGFAQGQTTPQIIAAVRGTPGMRFSDGALAVVDRNIKSATRTALQHAAVQAREATWKANAVVRRVRIVATLDTKTSDICQGMDGRVFPVDSGPRPPFHHNCRTTVVPELDDRYAFLDEGATRFARDEDGKAIWVDANETYYGWLKRQPADFQDSVIGPTRGKLLRNGGLTSERFSELSLDKNFKPRTLDEMRELEPIGFGKANL